MNWQTIPHPRASAHYMRTVLSHEWNPWKIAATNTNCKKKTVGPAYRLSLSQRTSGRNITNNFFAIFWQSCTPTQPNNDMAWATYPYFSLSQWLCWTNSIVSWPEQKSNAKAILVNNKKHRTHLQIKRRAQQNDFIISDPISYRCYICSSNHCGIPSSDCESAPNWKRAASRAPCSLLKSILPFFWRKQ